MSKTIDCRIARWIRGTLSLCAMSYLGACQSDGPGAAPASSQATQAVQIADLVGANQTSFFPFGFFIDGQQLSEPTEADGFLTTAGFFNAGPPPDPIEAARYYDETLTQIRSLGMNAMLSPNMDIVGVNADPHLKVLTTSAAKLGHLYAAPGARAIQALTTLPNDFKADVERCQSHSDADIDTAVRDTLTAAVESCTNAAGTDTGHFCNAYQCARANTSCCGAGETCTRKPSSQSLLGFYTLDEVSEDCVPAMRQVNRHLSFYQPSMSGFASISRTYVNEAKTISSYRGNLMDKMLGHDHVLHHDSWPLMANTSPPTPQGDVFALEEWAKIIDDSYMLAPADKPLYYQIQAGSDCCIRRPSPAEVRYMTYAALARGVQGLFYFLYGAQQQPLGGGGPADSDYHLDDVGRELRSLGASLRVLSPWLAEASRDLPRKNGRPEIASAARTDGQGSEGAAYDLDVTSFTTKYGERMVMLVNEQMGPGDPSTIPYLVTVDAAAATALFTKGAVRVRDLLTNTVVAGPTSGPALSFAATLAQGEGRLYQLQSDYSAAISIAREAYHNPVVAPKPIKVQVRITNTGALGWTLAGSSNARLGVHIYPPDGSARIDVLGISLGGNVAPGATTTVTAILPTGPGTSITQSGTYQLGFDVYKETGTVWLNNEQRISAMVIPSGNQPLLVETFDTPPFGSIADTLRKWDRTELMKIRDDKLAINGGNHAVSHWGGEWTNYTAELDLMIDRESQTAAARAGWTVRSSTPGRGYAFVLNAKDADANANAISVMRLETDGGRYPIATLPTGLTIERGAWYHIKQVVNGTSNLTITTQIKPVGSSAAPTSLATVNVANAYGAGGIGFLLNEPAYSAAGCSGMPNYHGGEIVGTCGLSSGGPTVQTLPCVVDSNCPTGMTCRGESDHCYPTLERGHFDNVLVYEPVSTGVITQVGNVTGSATGYPWTLTWSRPESVHAGDALVSHYRVYRNNNCSFTPSAATLVAEPAAPEYVERTPGTFCYKVTAVSFADVESAASSGTSGQTLAAPAATTVTAVASQMKSVAVSWTAVASAARYEVHRGAPGFTPTPASLIATVAAPAASYQDAPSNVYVADTQLGLNGLATYRYAVVPVAADGSADPSVAGYSADVVPPGSNLFSDGFDGTSAKWQANSGTWAVSGSSYTQSDAACAATGGACSSTIKGSAPLLWPRLADLSIEATLQMDSMTGSTGFAGITIRKANTTDQFGASFSGYLAAFKRDGTVELRLPDGVVASRKTELAGLAKHRLRVDASGTRIRVFVDGFKYLDYIDEDRPAMAPGLLAGYVDLTTYQASASFFDVNVVFREGFSDMTLVEDFNAFTESECNPHTGPDYPTPCEQRNWLLDGSWQNVTTSDSETPDNYLLQGASSDVRVATKAGPRKYSDMKIEFRVKLTDIGGDYANWVGMEIRKANITDRFAGGSNSGYLIYYRANGEIGILQIGGGVNAINVTATAPSPITERKVWIQAEGGTIKVYVGAPADTTPPAVPVLEATDTSYAGGPRWRSGYIDFTTYHAGAEFRRLSVGRLLPNWATTTSAGTYDPRWMHQLVIPAKVGQTYSVAPRELKVADFTADYAVRIDNANGSNSRWAAFTFHKTNQNDNVFTSGYMVALRNTGELFLYGAPPMGQLGSCTIPVPSSYQQIRVRMQGTAIQVYANGSTTPCISVTNATSWPSGYVDLSASETTARFEYLEIY